MADTEGTRRWAARSELDAVCGARLRDAALDGLWVAGELDGLRAPCVAIVGTRAPTDAGRRRARAIAEDLARAGVCVVSGLALGVDGAAHEGALAAGAPTIGVLGGGHARFFPPRNRELACRMIAGGGAVVSPFAPDVLPQPWQFLARNAIIAALSDAVLVVEAAQRSGALNTAGHAADRGIPVLAIPGEVDRPKAAGCNALIRDGATLVRDADDVLAALPAGIIAPAAVARRRHRQAGAPRRETPAPTPAGRDSSASLAGGDSDAARRMLRVLRDAPCDAGTLADRVGLAAPAVFALLAELELANRVANDAGTYRVAT